MLIIIEVDFEFVFSVNIMINSLLIFGLILPQRSSNIKSFVIENKKTGNLLPV